MADFVDYGEQKQWSMVGRAALRKLRRFNLKTWGLELARLTIVNFPFLSSNNDSLRV